MLPINLDLLNTTPHHANGLPRDAHAHHTQMHRAEARALIRSKLAQALRSLAAKIEPGPKLAPSACAK